jgi:ribonuclease Y
MLVPVGLIENLWGYAPYGWWILAGIAAGLGIHWLVSYRVFGRARARARERIEKARAESERLHEEAREKVAGEYAQWVEESDAERREIEAGLEDLSNLLKERDRDLAKRTQDVARRSRTIDQHKRDLHGLKIQRRKKDRELRRAQRQEKGVLLERAGMTEDEAKQKILDMLEAEVQREQEQRRSLRLEYVREDLEKIARRLVGIAIGRCTIGHDDNGMVGSFSLPSEDFKNRLLGPDNRNLRYFEELTGVNLVFDEQDPLSVALSAFDGMKKAIARRTLEKLISQNAEIQTGRIKEFVDKSTREMKKIILETGKKIAADLRVRGLNPEIQSLLGRLNYRTSYGQNVLKHSKEVAFLASTLASEMGIDPKLGKRCGLLHDIGKAVDADIEGGHPEIGAEIARRCKEPNTVVDAIAYHHEDADKIDTYPLLTQSADAISGSRPGARRETLERYLKHLEQLESIGQSVRGVETAYAIQAGRELRVFVDPQKVDDEEVLEICRGIAEQVENELIYPGKIKITVVRESKTAAYAR